MKNERRCKFKIGTWVLFCNIPVKIIEIRNGWYVGVSDTGEEFDFHRDYESECRHISKKKNPEYFI